MLTYTHVRSRTLTTASHTVEAELFRSAHGTAAAAAEAAQQQLAVLQQRYDVLQAELMESAGAFAPALQQLREMIDLLALIVQRYSIYLRYRYKSPQRPSLRRSSSCRRYSICLLYWYKSTNTDAAAAAV
jgi:hypothetical protein